MHPTNVFSSGSIVRGNSRNGLAIRTGGELNPGTGQRAKVTIANLGALPATLRLFEVAASNGFAAGRLGLAIREEGGGAERRVFIGEIGGVPPDGIELGSFGAGESRTYRFTVLLAKDTPEEEWGRSAGAAYEWEAVFGGR